MEFEQEDGASLRAKIAHRNATIKALRAELESGRLIFVDGRGDHWLSTGRTDTDDYALLASIDAPDSVESTESILQRTGSLRPIGRCVAELEAPAPAELTVYRAARDSITLGLYADVDDARAHCGSLVWREQDPAATEVQVRWHPETPDDDSAEGLFLTVDGEETDTGYTVSPLNVHAAYDAGSTS
jgi:hypothetical protein